MQSDSASTEEAIELSDISLNDNTCSFNISNEIGVEKHRNDRDELVDELMSLCVRHNLTKAAVEDIAKLINKVPGATVEIPSTKYLLFKESLRKSPLKISKYVYCAKCDEFSKYEYLAKDLICEMCQTNLKQSKTTFIYLSTASQLTKIISDNFDDIINYEKRCNEHVGNDIFDVHDGKFLKDVLQNGHFYSLTFNTDGVAVHSSSISTFWPILLTCNFLPPNIRFQEKNMIVAALYYGVEKPNFLKFLVPLCEEFQHLSNVGLAINSVRFKFIISHASLDLPAKCAIQCITQYNGYNACGYCKHTGEKTSKGIRYTTVATKNSQRIHSDFISNIQYYLKTGNSIDGVKGLSPMLGFKHFDMVRSFTIDYMHQIPLGIVKNLLSFWWDTDNNKKPFYILPKLKQIVNRRIATLKPFRYTNRRLEPLNHYSKFKASQCRDFLLYYHPILEGILKEKYYKHFLLLSSAIYLLLKPTITENDLHTANANLQDFVTKYEIYYGKESMTMNVHALTHLVEGVKHMGPLWAYSMFWFESFNGRLKKYGQNSPNVINQIVEKIYIQSTKTNETEKEETASHQYFSDEISAPIIEQREIAEIKKICDIEKCKFHATFNKGKIKFTSKMYKRVHKSMDYFLYFENDCYGKVLFYFEQEKSYALIEEYFLENKVDHVMYVRPKGKITIKLTSEIKDKLIFMNIGLKQIVVMRPNKFEIN